MSNICINDQLEEEENNGFLIFKKRRMLCLINKTDVVWSNLINVNV